MRPFLIRHYALTVPFAFFLRKPRGHTYIICQVVVWNSNLSMYRRYIKLQLLPCLVLEATTAIHVSKVS
jgi:hypothetical protein